MTNQSEVPKWFYCDDPSGKIEGPFDLVELAGLLRAGDITGKTLTRLEGDDSWEAFQNRREFQSAADMPEDVIYRHLRNGADAKKFPWGIVYYFPAFILGLFAYWFHPGIGFSGSVNLFLNIMRGGLKHFLEH